MNKLCSPSFFGFLQSCFSSKQDQPNLEIDKHINESIYADTLVMQLNRRKNDLDEFLKTVFKDNSRVLSNLLILEDEVDQGNFDNVIESFDKEIIERNISDPQMQVYLYYLVLKVEVVKHNKLVSMDSLVSRKYDFKADAVISEFIQNLHFLKNINKFIVFEDKDDKTTKEVIAKRLSFFEWLSIRLFKLLLLFCCSIDNCKDNKELSNINTKVKDYYDICERYLISACAYNAESIQRDKLKNFIEVYAKELLMYLKMYSFNRDNESISEEVKTLELINLSITRLIQQHPLIFIKLKQAFENFDTRVKILKAKYASPTKKANKGKRRTISESNFEKASNTTDEYILEDGELPDEILELLKVENDNKLSTIKEMSSRYEKQSSAFDIGEDDFNKWDVRRRPMVRRSSFSKLRKTNANFI